MDTHSSPSSKFPRSLERFAIRYVQFCRRRPLAVSLGCLLLAGLALIPALRLDVDPNLVTLLPKDTPSRKALEELRHRFTSGAPLYLLVESNDIELNQSLAREVQQRASLWPETQSAINQRNVDFFLKNRLLYLPADEIHRLADEVEEKVEWRRCEAIPGCVNFDDEPEGPDTDRLKEKIRALPAVQSLAGIVGGSSVDRAIDGGQQAASQDSSRDRRDSNSIGDLCSDDGRVCAVEVVLRGRPTDLEFAIRMVKKAEAMLREVRPESAPKDLRMVVSGQYRNAPIIKQTVMKDLGRTTLVSLTLLVLLLAWQFRGLRALVVLLVPLAAGALWTAGVIGLVLPTLNLISAFTLVVLAGVGIDFGVHLLSHYGHERQQGHTPEESLLHTMPALARSMLNAAITTGCGFGALAVAKFPGFSQLGLLAGIGIVLTLVASVVLFPPLVLLTHRLWPERHSPVRSWSWLPHWATWLSGPTGRRMWWVSAILVAVFAAVGTQIDFEYNTRKLNPATVRHGIPWKAAVHGSAKTAVYMLADSPKDLEQAADAIRQEDLTELELPHDPARDTTASILTPAAFLPEHQPARLQAIARLRDVVQDAKRHVDEELLGTLNQWQPQLEVTEPITADSLPQWASAWLREKDGSFGTIGVFYSPLRGRDAREMEVLADRMNLWSEKYPKVRFASPVALLGEIVPGLRRDAFPLIGLALLGLLVGTLIMTRSVRTSVTVLVPTVSAVALTLGVMVLTGQRINLYNMLVFPLAFGIGVDGAIYMVDAHRRQRAGEAGALLTSTRAVLGSTLTTAGAFGALTTANNPGVATIGTLALTAMGAALCINLAALPSWLRRKRG